MGGTNYIQTWLEQFPEDGMAADEFLQNLGDKEGFFLTWLRFLVQMEKLAVMNFL